MNPPAGGAPGGRGAAVFRVRCRKRQPFSKEQGKPAVGSSPPFIRMSFLSKKVRPSSQGAGQT